MLNKRLYKVLQLLAILVITSGCSNIQEPVIPDSVAEIRPGIAQGYLGKDEIPNSLSLVPAPPAEGSTALALDKEISENSISLQGTPRWELATKDADLSFPAAADVFSCALGVSISQENTPHLYMLLRRTLADAGLSTYGAKNNYQRTRPFVINNKPTCTPKEEEHLKKDGSYPSGHTSIGWAWALILAEISPEQGDTILARGRDYGQSRVVCNVHWQSDVNEGRLIGSSAVSRLHTDPIFRAELEAAKSEVLALRSKNLISKNECKAENKALLVDTEK